MPDEHHRRSAQLLPRALVICADATLGRRLVQQCGGSRHVEHVSCLEGIGRRDRDVVIIVVDLAAWDSVSHAVGRARSLFQSAALIIFLRRDAVSGALIEAARRADVDYIAVEGIDDVADRLRVACRGTQARVDVAVAFESILNSTPPRFQRLLRLAIARSTEPTRVGEAARILGVHRKTLFVWCAEARTGIGPHGVLLWPRILLAARMLEQGTPSIQSVALALGFPSGSALSAAMRRLTGRAPSDVLPNGAFVAVREALYAVTGRGPWRARDDRALQFADGG